jgi:hypothetical protein
MNFQKDIQFKVVPPVENPSVVTSEQQFEILKAQWKKALIEGEKWSNGTIKKVQLDGDPAWRYFYCLRTNQSGSPQTQVQTIVAIDEDLKPKLVNVSFQMTPQGYIMKATAEPILDRKAYSVELNPDKVARIVQDVIAGRV